MNSWARIWPSGYDLNLSAVVLVTMKKQRMSWEKPIACWSAKTHVKVSYYFHTYHALTMNYVSIWHYKRYVRPCAEQLIPAQTISMLSRWLTFAKSGAWPLWKHRNNTWFLVQSFSYSGQVLGAMVQISSSDNDKDDTKTAGFGFVF